MARRTTLLVTVLAVLLVGAVLARAALGIWATVVVKGAFFDALGMGAAYETRWHATAVLGLLGLALGVLLSVPLLSIGLVATQRRHVSHPEGVTPLPIPGLDWEWAAEIESRLGLRPGKVRVPRSAVLALWAVVAAILAAIAAAALMNGRDEFLAALNRHSFGVADPVFGRDVSFHIFTVPALERLAGLLTALALLTGLATAAAGFGLALALPDRRARLAQRTESALLGFGALLTGSIAVLVWLSRFDLLHGQGELVAGAGASASIVSIPARGALAVLLALWTVALALLAFAPIRRRALPTLVVLGWIALGTWAVASLYLAVTATLWWIVPLLVLALAAPVWAGALGPSGRLRAPTWAVGAAVALTAIGGPVMIAATSRLYEALVLRGTPLQVERSYIEDTIESTRSASGIDKAITRTAEYERSGVTPQAIAAAPASVAALRFLDLDATLQAATKIALESQYYRFADIDVDRYELAGQRRTVFALGREIDYSALPDFQRRHLSYTHGYGVVLAPVNEIDAAGRPRFIADGIPQTDLPLERPEIYFGTAPATPWALVDTDQPQFLADRTRPVTWDGTTGLKVGANRLALTLFLGGMPVFGGGRRFWNSTDGTPADAQSQVLLYRDAIARGHELAPFLRFDDDPYFTISDGRIHVLANAYVTSDRYPYSATYLGSNYQRGPVIMDMDAYTGETRLYVLDPDEPMLATYRDIYPELFTPVERMPPDLRKHLRYGESLLEYQSAVLERFHVTDVDSFFNQDDAWAVTEERVGPGVAGVRVTSPARYTYAVVPGDTSERFVAIRTYKPRLQGRGIAFSAWLAVDNEPDAFGRLTVLRFQRGEEERNLDSVETFVANVSRDSSLSQEIGTRRDSILRGNTIVVPIGRGLLYTQPLYLDAPGDQLPTLWRVVVSFGDGRVFAAPSFAEALELAFDARGGTGGEGPGTGGPATVDSEIAAAGAAVAAAEKALVEAREALARARALQRGEPPPAGGEATAPTETAPAGTTTTEAP